MTMRVLERWTRWMLPALTPASGWKLTALACGALLGGAASGAGCGRDAEDPAVLDAVRQALSGGGQTCVSIQRGASGAVEDATLWEAIPTLNDGADTRIRTGLSGFYPPGRLRALLRFDLAGVPSGATIVSGALRLVQTPRPAGSAVEVHRVTEPWTEDAVTWNALGEGFGPLIEGTLSAGALSGERTVDLTPLIQAWVLGTSPNHGLLLLDPADELDKLSKRRTDWSSSENSHVADRPRLDVCYVTCSDGVQNGAELAVDCGGPLCAPCPGGAGGGGGDSSGSGGGGGNGGCPAGAGLPLDASPPAALSATGLYADIAGRVVAPHVREYRPAYELWSDAAVKRRFVYLPPCSAIDTGDMDHWSLPVGTRLWKELQVGGALVETRLAHRFGPGDDDWLFAAYQWGAADALHVPAGVPNASGTSHDIPPANACWACHGYLPERALGFSALQLSHAGPGETLLSLSQAGLLSDPPPVGGIHPPGGPVASAALGYLHANCGSCHNPYGVTTLRTHLVMADTSVEDTEAFVTSVGVPSSFSAPGITHRIVPGDPDASALAYRMAHRSSLAQMPPLATEVVDTAGLEAVRQWIASLTPIDPGGAGGSGSGGGTGSGGGSGNGGGSGSGSGGGSGGGSGSGSGGGSGSGRRRGRAACAAVAQRAPRKAAIAG